MKISSKAIYEMDRQCMQPKAETIEAAKHKAIKKPAEREASYRPSSPH